MSTHTDFSTYNPATGIPLKSYRYVEPAMAEKFLLESEQDFQSWRKRSLSERQERLLELAAALREHKQALAEMMNQEMGKLLREGLAEVEKSATTCEYYAQEASTMLSPEKVASSPYSFAQVSFQPLGVVFCIMPWNFPLWQVIRFAAPALMAGNTIVLKHADLTAGTGALIGEIFKKLKGPELLLRNVHVTHEGAARLIAHPLVRGVTFTGSSQGGRAVALEAAKNLKKVVLELGGSDAYVVLGDADVSTAALKCAQVRLINSGQSCVAGKRFIVVEKVAETFIAEFTRAMKTTDIAPLASRRFRDHIVQQVEQLKSLGGVLLTGGVVPSGDGAFYPPTVVLFEKNHPDLHKEEVFGPVASVIIVKDTQEALQVANASPFGLGGGLFTQDVKRGKELVEQEMQAGFVVVNDYVKSDPRIPFGGIKESGFGRELGRFGILEFVNIKTVAVNGDVSWN